MEEKRGKPSSSQMRPKVGVLSEHSLASVPSPTGAREPGDKG